MPNALRNFMPSVDELNLASRLLEMNSWNRSDSLSVDTAIGIFKQSGLSFKQLREIWSIADKDGSGKLSKEELAVVIRLMGWVQAGKALDEGLLGTVGPLPKIKGIPDVAVASIDVDIEFPVMTAKDTEELRQAFLDSDPINGALHRHKVMKTYMGLKPDMSFETLFRVMSLVEKNQFGEVEFKSFAIGMHVVRNLHIFPISSAPVSIPPEVHNTLDAIRISSWESQPESGQLSAPMANDEVKSSSIRLPAEVDSDIHNFMKDIKQHQNIRGDMTLKFMSTYKVDPGELAQIWRKSDFNTKQNLTPARLTLIEQLVRQKLATKVSQSQTRISASAPPSYYTSPTEQDLTASLPANLHQTSEAPSHLSPQISGLLPSSTTVDPPAYVALTELVASMETTIKELELRSQFLRASTIKAVCEAEELRQTVLKQEQEIAELRRPLEEEKSFSFASQTDKDLRALRKDHDSLKTQMADMQRFMEQHVLSSSAQFEPDDDLQTLMEAEGGTPIVSISPPHLPFNIPTDLEKDLPELPTYSLDQELKTVDIAVNLVRKAVMKRHDDGQRVHSDLSRSLSNRSTISASSSAGSYEDKPSVSLTRSRFSIRRRPY